MKTMHLCCSCIEVLIPTEGGICLKCWCQLQKDLKVKMCNQENCPQSAKYRFTWPGHDEAYICDLHVGHLKKVAEALALHLQVIPLIEDTEEDEKTT